MPKSIFTFSLLLFVLTTNAQTWHTSFKNAQSIAIEENKTILLVFQGSDWCAPCMKLDREIWQSDKFIEFAKAKLVLLKADFPRKKKNALSKDQNEHNKKLAEKYNSKGYFPLVLILDIDGNILGSTGYKKTSVNEYIKTLNEFIP